MEDKKEERQKFLDFFGSIPNLQQLPESSVTEIANLVKVKCFGAGDYIVQEGDVIEGIYFILQGEAKVRPMIEVEYEGNEIPLLKSGDHFGYASTGSIPKIHEAGVVAITEVICLVLCHEHADLLSKDSIWGLKNDIGIADIEVLLNLESIEVDLFRGIRPSTSLTSARVFGGELVAQALAAASKSVDPSLLVHSLHSCFLESGDINIPIIYKVERLRNSKSFSTRQVVAMQSGSAIFTMFASFQRTEEGYEHQEPMPAAPDPEKAISVEEYRQAYCIDPKIPLHSKNRDTRRNLSKKIANWPIEVRYCDPEDRLHPVAMEPRKRTWIRARGKLSDDQALQRCVAAYASDIGFVETSLRPHRDKSGYGLFVVSLDHSLWFHKSFRADEWLLFVMESPRACNARGMVLGRMYTRAGELVVSVAQEAVMRQFNKTKAKQRSKL